MLALNDYFLDRGYLLSAFHTISINPGETKQALHHDDGYITVPRPRRPFGAAIMVCPNPLLWSPRINEARHSFRYRLLLMNSLRPMVLRDLSQGHINGAQT